MFEICQNFTKYQKLVNTTERCLFIRENHIKLSTELGWFAKIYGTVMRHDMTIIRGKENEGKTLKITRVEPIRTILLRVIVKTEEIINMAED